jgi:hypothetical protein
MPSCCARARLPHRSPQQQSSTRQLLGIYQARHNWGTHAVAASVSGDLFPTKDAGAGVAPQQKQSLPPCPDAARRGDKWRACVWFATTRAPCQNVCTQTHGSALDSLGSCWSAVKATGTQRTCCARAHWGSSRPSAGTCEWRAENSGFWARRQPRFLTHLTGKRAPGLHKRPGWGTNDRRPRCQPASTAEVGCLARDRPTSGVRASCSGGVLRKNSVPLAGDLCPAATPQPVSHVRCGGARLLSPPSAMAPHHYLQPPVRPASCPAFARSIKPVLFTQARPGDKGSLDLPQLLLVHIHVHCFQCDYKLQLRLTLPPPRN